MNYAVMMSAIIKELGEDNTYSTKMASAIELWSRMYSGNAPWLGSDTFSAGTAAAVASEAARLMTIELKAGNAGPKPIMDELHNGVIPKLRKYSEYGLAKGSLIIKPIVIPSGLVTQFIQADSFYPLAFDSSGEMTKCVLIDQKRIGRTIYTRMEIHSIADGVLTVENKAYRSMSDGFLGARVPLNEVPEWSMLADEQKFTGINKLPFGLFRSPVANQIDSTSPLGVSIYSRATEHIKEADRRYSDICWEYEAKQAAVHLSESMMKYDRDNDKYVAPAGRDRLYRAMPFYSGATDKPLIEVYSPDIRSSAYFEGFNAQLRLIEFDCSLAYGTISDPQAVDKTATEVKASKQRSYTMITDCQAAMTKALTDWADGALFWARLYGLDNSSSVTLELEWGDSVLSDPQLERDEDRKDVSMGVMRPEEYRAKWYGEDIETALNNLPEPAQVME